MQATHTTLHILPGGRFPAGTRYVQLVRALSVAVISASGVSLALSKYSTFVLHSQGLLLLQEEWLKAARLKGGGVNPQEGL